MFRVLVDVSRISNDPIHFIQNIVPTLKGTDLGKIVNVSKNPEKPYHSPKKGVNHVTNSGDLFDYFFPKSTTTLFLVLLRKLF